MAQKIWDSTNIPDQNGRVVIVTGSSSGIGYEAARVLAEKNATVVIAVRSLDKGKAAADKIMARHKSADIKVMELDLANLKSVRKFSEAVKKKYSRLDLLINNAGVMIPPYSKTTDGFELQMGTNHFGHFALTGLLMDLLINTNDSRIVNVSSAAHRYGNIDFSDLNWEGRRYRAWAAYGDSKIANLYFTYELQRRLDAQNSGVTATAAHPGWTATELQRHNRLFMFMNKFFAQGIDMGALPTLYAATAPDVSGADYFGPSGWKEWKGYPKKVQSNALSHDNNIAAKLWEVSQDLTDVKYQF